jgi:hypothetical protein
MTHECREQLGMRIDAHARSVEKSSIFGVEEVGTRQL